MNIQRKYKINKKVPGDQLMFDTDLQVQDSNKLTPPSSPARTLCSVSLISQPH